jgi:hypothetical protein
MKNGCCWAHCLLAFAFLCQATLAQGQPANVVGAAATNLTATPPASTNTATKSLDFKKDAPAWVSNSIALVSLIVSAINLWIVVHFFFRSSSERVSERNADRAERDIRTTREVGNFWIQELILRSSNDFVHGFFDTYENKIEEFHKRCETSGGAVDALAKDAGDLVREFKSEFHKLDKRLVEPLEWVSPQFKQLRPILDEIEDLVTEEFGTIRLPVNSKQDEAFETPVMKFRSLRRDFFRRMHDCHKEFIGISGTGQQAPAESTK